MGFAFPRSVRMSDSHRPPRERRRFLAKGLGLAGAAAALAPIAGRAAAPPGAVERPVPADPSKVPGYPMDDESYGARSQFETEVRQRYKTATPLSSWTFTPLQDSMGSSPPRACSSSAATPAPP
jgi:sulfane dehydrogenase subunit SoxC